MALFDNKLQYSFMKIVRSKISEIVNEWKLRPDHEIERKLRSYVSAIFDIVSNPEFEKHASLGFWNNMFPEEWKIQSKNSEEAISFMFRDEFFRYLITNFSDKIEKKRFLNTRFVDGLFPNAHPLYFNCFLKLRLASDLEESVVFSAPFYLSSLNYSTYGFKTPEDLRKESLDHENIIIDDTFRTILNYFYDWEIIEIYREDFEDIEYEEYLRLSDAEKIKKKNLKRILKLKKLKTDISNIDVSKIKSEFEKQVLESRRAILVDFCAKFAEFIQRTRLI